MKECIVLGSGNAFHVDGRGHAGFLLDGKILLDCGPTVLLKSYQLGVDLSSVDLVLVTHFHGDHFGGLPYLLMHYKYVLKRQKPVFIAGYKGIKETFFKYIDLLFPGLEFPFPVEFVELQKNSVWNFQEYRISAYPVTHNEESIGYRIEDKNHSLAFSGDTLWDENVFVLMEGVDTGILEVSYLHRQENASHVSLEEVLGERNRLKVKRLYFSHLDDAVFAEIKKLQQQYPDFGEPLYDGYKIIF